MNAIFNRTSLLLGSLAAACLVWLLSANAVVENETMVDTETNELPTLLEPATEHSFATRLTTRFLSSYHYRRLQLDDPMSERIFDQYIELLDPNKMYFMASDISDLKRYQTHLDDVLMTAELDPAFDIFNLYVRRVEERVDYAQQLLQSEFDFNVDESYYYDREDLPWADSRAELEDLWRQRVKNDWLGLMLTEQSDKEIRETLTARYDNIQRRVSEFNNQDAFQFFMNAYARSIEPHSSYMSPRLADNFEISMKLSLDGIGALLGSEGEYVAVQSIVPGGPADLDGRLQPGDRIIGVGQGVDAEIMDVVGWRLDDVVDQIRGERDTTVRLQLLPAQAGAKGAMKTIDIVRNEVKLEEQAAQAHVEEIEVDGQLRRMGIIEVPVFYVDFRGRAQNEPNYRSSTRDVRRLIQDLRQEGVEGIVMDLRGNGGGALDEATTMVGLFIDEGPVVQVRDASGRISVESDYEPGMAWEGPLAVLVNRHSASASEIFAAAIQDYNRGVILGEPTFGKGTVQNLFNLDDFATNQDIRLGQVKLTMAEFFRVDGGSTQSLGVQPDIMLPSFGDPAEYGESSLDFALPWTQINSADYEALGDFSPLLPVAQQRHLNRRQTDQELMNLVDELNEWEARSQRKSISLLASVREQEYAEAEAKRIERYGPDPVEANTDDETPDNASNDEPLAVAANSENEEEPDVLMLESARILADLIDLDDGQQLLVHRAEPIITGSMK
ncbi:MAG: carboxy terminal-processing peptidase [Pseudomonadota bacterium]